MTPVDAIRIRMYCQGFGDCFLLTYMTGQQPVAHMLIDCGVLMGTQNGSDRIRAVAGHIRETLIKERTDGKPADSNPTLDYLLVTHEHWDHLSGFVYAKDFLDSIQVNELWLPWTENPVAGRSILDDRARKFAALTAARSTFALNPDLDDLDEKVAGFLDFFGPVDAESDETGNGSATGLGAAGKKKAIRSTTDVMDKLRGLSPKTKITYCQPGSDTITLKNSTGPLSGLRVYVLGPPTDARLFSMLESNEKGVLYLGGNGGLIGKNSSGFGLMNALDTGSGLTYSQPMFPGVPTKMVGDEAELIGPFADEFPGAKAFFDTTYKSKAWRGIENDWLGAAEGLALKLDEETNNTSLAIAIEGIENGKVLLFPADAQVGNLQSWKNCSWRVSKDGQDKDVKIDDLLAQTVLYKAGHHGSHNATLNEDGLEKMTHPDLVAMVTFEKVMVKDKKNPPNLKQQWPSIPHSALLQRLKDRTRERTFVVGDWQTWKDQTNEGKLRDVLSDGEFDQFIAATHAAEVNDAKFIEYRINL